MSISLFLKVNETWLFKLKLEGYLYQLLCYCSVAHLISLTIFGSYIYTSGKQFNSMSNRMFKAIFLHIYVL